VIYSLLEMGRYMQVYHTGTFCFEFYTGNYQYKRYSFTFFPFFRRCVLVSLLRSILGLLNFHFGKWVYLAMLSIAETFQSNFNAFELVIIQCHTTIVIHCYLKTSAFISYTKGVRTRDLLGLHMLANDVFLFFFTLCLFPLPPFLNESVCR
jgi:hypothetical protein